VANTTAEDKINHGRWIDINIADVRILINSATMNMTRRLKRSAIQPATGLINNSVRLMIATKVATPALPCPEPTRIHEHATA
jgi:hypothetical protein